MLLLQIPLPLKYSLPTSCPLLFCFYHIKLSPISAVSMHKGMNGCIHRGMGNLSVTTTTKKKKSGFLFTTAKNALLSGRDFQVHVGILNWHDLVQVLCR